jgi:hypothetical protein
MLDMDKRLRDMPVMVQRPDSIDARTYNVWRRARNRWGAPMRLNLPGLREIVMILDDDYWACVDSTRHDLPVLAWVELEDAGRDSLHLPIPCKLNYYHVAASAIRAKSLDLMAQHLTERLSR